MTQDLDIEGRLKMYFPAFFELLGDNRLDWRTITKVFGRKLEQWQGRSTAVGGDILVEASLFNVIARALEGHTQARSLQKFITNVFEELVQRLDMSERKLTVRALFGLLTNVDRKYLNFLGELCVLNHIKKNPKFQLVEVEIPVVAGKPDGPTFDFKFLNKDTSTYSLVEIVSVHLNDMAVWPDEKVNNLLHQKLLGKLNNKDIQKTEKFILVPVFWGSFDELKRIDSFYKENVVRFRNTFEPMCFMSFTKSDGKVFFMFGTISSILDVHSKANEL